jgi:hypothetical protein
MLRCRMNRSNMKDKKDIKDKRKNIIGSFNEFKAITKYCKTHKITVSKFMIDCAMEKVKNESMS